MSNILFCGSYVPHGISSEINNCSQAANNFQHAIIKNLSKNHKIDILTYIGYFEENISILKKALEKDKINYVLKQENNNYYSVFKKYYKIFNRLLIEKDIVILYNYNYLNFFINRLCRRKKIKSILILADHTDAKEQNNLLRKILALKYGQDYKKFNYIAFLSEKLKKKYPESKSVLLQGGIEVEKYEKFQLPKIGSRYNILYSGVINKVTGIDIYLNAIKLLEEVKINFLFTGKGDLENLILKEARSNKNIKYYGLLNEKKYLGVLKTANILINPRNMNLLQNDNNFPSKILEYLATGRLVISTRFSGYENFNANITFCGSDSYSLASAIKDLIRKYNKNFKKIYKLNRKKALEFSWEKQIIKLENLITND
jgi:hypothetical protein